MKKRSKINGLRGFKWGSNPPCLIVKKVSEALILAGLRDFCFSQKLQGNQKGNQAAKIYRKESYDCIRLSEYCVIFGRIVV